MHLRIGELGAYQKKHDTVNHRSHGSRMRPCFGVAREIFSCEGARTAAEDERALAQPEVIRRDQKLRQPRDLKEQRVQLFSHWRGLVRILCCKTAGCGTLRMARRITRSGCCKAISTLSALPNRGRPRARDLCRAGQQWRSRPK